MAKTYYKYKDRGQQVDYAEISRNFSQGIMDTVTGIKKEADEFSDEVKEAQEGVKKDVEERFKQKRKGEGKSVTGEGDYKIELGEYDLPMGGERDANSVFVGLSTEASDRALEFKREYDSQKISANEYLQKKNALDRTFSVMKESAVGMNQLAQETATGLKDGTIDPTQQLAFQELMSYNFTDPRVKIEIGDNGEGYMYRVDDKGKELPNTRKTINEYRNMALQRYDAYDFDGNSSAIVDKLGKTLETLGRRGMTTEELLKREPIMTSVNGGTITPMNVIDDYANGLEDDDLASILMAQLGSDYSPTFNPEESVAEDASGNFTDDQSKILFVKRDLASGINKKTAQLTDEQRERAREFVKTDILSQFNVGAAPTVKTSEYDKKETQRIGNEKEKATKYVDTLKKLFLAKDKDQRERAMRMLGESIGTDKFASMKMNAAGDVMKLTTIGEDGKLRPRDIKFTGTLREFIETAGPELSGLEKEDAAVLWKYIDEVLDKDSGNKTATKEQGGYDIGYVYGPKKQELDDFDYAALEGLGKTKLSASYLMFGDQLSDFENATNKVIASTGLKGAKVAVSGDEITISHPDFGSASFTVDTGKIRGQTVNSISSDMMEAIKKIYDAATTGVKIGEGGASQFNK
jgi:hypothetical protein